MPELRITHRHTRAGRRERPAAGLQPNVRWEHTAATWNDGVRLARRDRGPAGRPGRRPGFLHREPLEGAAHDSAVILEDVNLAAVASGHMSNVFDIGDNEWRGRPRGPILPSSLRSRASAALAARSATATGTRRPHVGRRSHHPRLGAGRWRRAGVRGDRPGREEELVLLRLERRLEAGAVRAPAAADRDGELHDPQLQHRADEQATCSWAATTRRASASSISPTRRTPRKSPTPTRRRSPGIRFRASRGSSAETGRRTGATAASTSPTSRAG